jgi:hypothetical protein
MKSNFEGWSSIVSRLIFQKFYFFRLSSQVKTTRFPFPFLGEKFSPVILTDSNGLLVDGFEYVENVDGRLKLRLNLVTHFRIANLHLTG